MVVDAKWMAHLSATVRSEIEHVSHALTGRIRQLAQRYSVPLPKLTEKVENLTARVEGHLEKMGAVWN